MRIGHQSALDWSATMTAYHTEGATSAAGLIGQALSSSTGHFGGAFQLPPLTSEAVMTGGGHAIAVHRYGIRGGGGGRNTNLISEVRATWETFRRYKGANGLLTLSRLPTDVNGEKVAVPRLVPTPCLDLFWLLSDEHRPGINQAVVDAMGSTNNKAFTFEGISFAENTVLFRGATQSRQKSGSTSRYTTRFHATFCPERWVNQTAPTDNPPTAETVTDEEIYPQSMHPETQGPS